MSTDRPWGSEPAGSDPPWPPDSGGAQPDPYPGQPAAPSSSSPAPYAGYGSPGAAQPLPVWPDTGAPAYPGGTTSWPSEPALRRPGSVTGAVVLSWIGAGVFALLGVLAMLSADNPAFLSGFESSVRQPLDRSDVTTVLRGLGVLMLLWGIGVLLAATFTWRRRNWARIALSVMGVIYCLFQLFGLASGVIAAVPSLLWVVVSVGLLWTQSARDWFAGRSGALEPSNVRPPQPW